MQSTTDYPLFHETDCISTGRAPGTALLSAAKRPMMAQRSRGLVHFSAKRPYFHGRPDPKTWTCPLSPACALHSAVGTVALARLWGSYPCPTGSGSLLLHRRNRSPTLRESLAFVAFWCLLALGFNAFVAWWRGPAAGIEFLTGYLLEWSLSMDNVFVFAVIFRYFQIPLDYQYRVLFWGILGAILMRLGFVLGGVALVERFKIVLPIFGLVLLWSAAKLARGGTAVAEPGRNPVLRLARRFLPIAEGSGIGPKGTGPCFRPAAVEPGHATRRKMDQSPALPPPALPRGPIAVRLSWFAKPAGGMPLLVVLLVIETSDLVFAMDSVPAIFGITRDAFIIFTSNVFAILGLRGACTSCWPASCRSSGTCTMDWRPRWDSSA